MRPAPEKQNCPLEVKETVSHLNRLTTVCSGPIKKQFPSSHEYLQLKHIALFEEKLNCFDHLLLLLLKKGFSLCVKSASVKWCMVMENARVFAQGERDERRFNLHLVRFPERSPSQGNLSHQGFFTCNRSHSVVCSCQMSRFCTAIASETGV